MVYQFHIIKQTVRSAFPALAGLLVVLKNVLLSLMAS